MARDIGEWLEGLGLARYAGAFGENEIDLDTLPHITEDDLKNIGVALGARRKLLAAIVELKSGAGQTSEDEVGDNRPSRAEAERRQLTVMFCDLVGSTALSQRIDPEDMRDVLTRYQDVVAGVIMRHGGYVANYLGDGVLAYFGWPRAHEDQAAQAVRAGLSAIAAVNGVTTPDGRALSARVGIATGLVVVGDLAGETARQADVVSGDTPNLAARLQGVAAPDQVVIDTITRQLLGAGFTLKDLEPQTLKGIAEPVAAWCVTGEADVVGRFEAAHAHVMAPLVGREQELDLLIGRWRVAAGGEGQAVLLSGEAGIGKSRLIEALHQRIAGSEHIALRYQCSPYHRNTALYPVIRQLEHAAGFASSDNDNARLDKLETLIAPSEPVFSEVMPLFAALCGLDYEARFGPSHLPPQLRRQRTLALLIDELGSLARRKPVLFLFEDAHWIDPTTQELLGEAVTRIVDLPVLMLVTHRPDWKASWAGQAQVTSLSLNRLSRAGTTELVREIAGDHVDDAAVVRIVARADGIPLFAEELTKALVEQSSVDEEAEIPATLQASLIARLDRLGPEAKDIAQRGAVLGREFPRGLPVSMADLTDEDLNTALGALVQSELLFRSGAPPDLAYTFKHALVRDTAYDSLTRARRADLHEKAAQAIENATSDEVGAAALVAHHYSTAKRFDRALPHWCMAARQALESSNYLETIANVRDGLAAAEQAEDATSAKEARRELYLCGGPAYGAVKGFAAPELQDAYTRARDLAAETGATRQQFMATWGLWHVNQMRHHFDAAEALAQQVLEIGERQEDDGLRLQAHHAAWTTSFLRDLETCRRHALRGVEIYDMARHRRLAFTFAGHDPGVCARIHLCWAPWYLGYADQALVASEDALELAGRLGHGMSQALASYYRAELHVFRREPAAAFSAAKTLVEFCDHSGISPQYRAAGRIVQGWAKAQSDGAAEGCAIIADGIKAFLDIGARFRLPHYQTLHAETQCLAGRIDAALENLHEAQRTIDDSHETIWQAEVDRHRGVAAALDRQAAEDVNAHFRAAITVAKQQKARSLELRSAANFAKHLSRHGRAEEARSALAPLYHWFTEGFDTLDLKEAKALLDELS